MADGHTLVVEGLSDATLRGLEAQAAAHARPLADELRGVLDQHAAAAPETPEQRKARIEWLLSESDRIRGMSPKGVAQTDSTVLVREDRDNDEPWR